MADNIGNIRGSSPHIPSQEPKQNKIISFFLNLLQSITQSSPGSNLSKMTKSVSANGPVVNSEVSNKAAVTGLKALNFTQVVVSKQPLLTLTESSPVMHKLTEAQKNSELVSGGINPAQNRNLEEKISTDGNGYMINTSSKTPQTQAVETFCERLDINGLELVIMGVTENNSKNISQVPDTFIKQFSTELKHDVMFGTQVGIETKTSCIQTAAANTLMSLDKSMKAASRGGTSLNFTILLPDHQKGGAHAINMGIGNTLSVAVSRDKALTLNSPEGRLGKAAGSGQETSLSLSSYFVPNGTALITCNKFNASVTDNIEEKVFQSLSENESVMANAELFSINTEEKVDANQFKKALEAPPDREWELTDAAQATRQMLGSAENGKSSAMVFYEVRF